MRIYDLGEVKSYKSDDEIRLCCSTISSTLKVGCNTMLASEANPLRFKLLSIVILVLGHFVDG